MYWRINEQMDWKLVKGKVTLQALAELEKKIAEMKSELILLRESAEHDTKSSMGDKYETGREMIQQEEDKIIAQLKQYKHHQQILQKIDLKANYLSAGPGALVVTSRVNCYVSASIGEMKGDPTVFFMSPEAPLAQALKGKKTGDVVPFNGSSFEILAVV